VINEEDESYCKSEMIILNTKTNEN